ncbi:MAG: (d)CMP kinase [Alphaproteobacteria bacterium]|nr:(d)CMP kinase [Alphaproteobacteria bacterium]
MAKPVIAVDGPAASGKGSLARRLAAHFGYAYLDTGKLYRAVGLAVLRAGGDPTDIEKAESAAKAIDPTHLDDHDLTGDAAASAASKVAAIHEVRAALRDFQMGFAAAPPDGAHGAVLDGRDIGTVICPDAPAKLFITADVGVRAERRHKELLSRGEASIYARVLQDLEDRDRRDTTRADAPLKPADDAVVLDTSALTIEEVLAQALRLIDGKLG